MTRTVRFVAMGFAWMIMAGAALAEVTWRSDLSGVAIPDQPVQGRLHGQTFVANSAKLDGSILELRQGQDFFPDLAVKLFLFKDAASLPGRSFELPSSAPLGSPHVHLQWREAGKDLPETKILMQDYTLRLELGEPDGETIPVGIYLCLPDEEQSVMAGRCMARLGGARGGELTLINNESAGADTGTLTFGPGGLPPIDFSRISPLAAVACILGMLAMMAGGIWFLIVAFLVHWGWGLAVLFIPFAQVVFLFMYADRAWKPFLVSLLGLILFMTGGFSLVHGAGDAMSAAFQDMPVEMTHALQQQTGRPNAAPMVAPDPDPPSITEDGVEVGARLTDVVRTLGAPKARFEQGDLIVLSYPQFTLISENGETVTSIEDLE